jgi:hypothetical protein
VLTDLQRLLKVCEYNRCDVVVLLARRIEVANRQERWEGSVLSLFHDL